MIHTSMTADNASMPAQIPMDTAVHFSSLQRPALSGGITGEKLLEYASAHVDIISMGELTHSVKALDISLEIIKE
jgi:nicotinate-nucleotide pyrophosphorylase